MTATAHKLARIFYRLWKSGGSFVNSGTDAYEEPYPERTLKNLQKKALALGFDLVAKPTAPGCVS